MILTQNAAQELEDARSANGEAPPSYRSEPTIMGPNEKIPTIIVSESGSAFPVPENTSSTTPLNSPPSIYASGSSSSRSSSYYALNASTSYRSEDHTLYSPFSRVPPEDLAYGPFAPIFLVALSKTLAKGFPPAPPPSTTRPHPFTSHDVMQDDWLRFLGEIKVSANLTQKDVERSYLPIISMIPIICPLASLSVQQFMKSQKRHKVVKVIDTWNHHFFGLRKLRVILMRGKTKMGGGPPAPFESSKESNDDRSPSDSKGPEAYWDDDVYRLLVVSV